MDCKTCRKKIDSLFEGGPKEEYQKRIAGLNEALNHMTSEQPLAGFVIACQECWAYYKDKAQKHLMLPSELV